MQKDAKSLEFDRLCKLLKLHKGLKINDISEILGVSEQKIKNMRYGTQKTTDEFIDKLKFELGDIKPFKDYSQEIQALRDKIKLLEEMIEDKNVIINLLKK